MQAVVGGLIQAIYPYEEPVAIVCNEEGLINQLPFNRRVPGGYDAVFGTFFICGLGAESFCSLTPEQVQKFKHQFRNAEMLFNIGDGKYKIIRFPAEQKKPPRDKGKSAPEHSR